MSILVYLSSPYPYEWSFSLIKDAAIFHLDLYLELLTKGFTLSDSSAYNVQFVGSKPIFIDHLSIRRYKKGEFWLGHRQFCEQFLIPLLMRAILDVPHNSWFRGNLEGIPLEDFTKLLRPRHFLSWNILTHIILQSRLQQRAVKGDVEKSIKKRKLPLSAFTAILKQLRKWIINMTPHKTSITTWGDYAVCNTYASEETSKKKQFIADFLANSNAKNLIDLGCNTGEYSKVALDSGVEQVLGFDFDQQALDKAHRRAKEQNLNFLPLFLDAKNPSPNQGWRQTERQGLSERVQSDTLIALAFEHHLAIAHNIPLEQVIQWITKLAPSGVIEFVPKNDPTVRKMLSLREDIFFDYTEENFSKILNKYRRIVKQETITDTDRVLYAFSN